ncbi:MAG: PKD domain containing protein [Actinobacteria bacterium]|nr:MAG: PKD domain containing protein [Actinomycetota bacterium]
MHRKLIVAAALAAVAVAGAVPAVADTAQARVVSDNPVDFTPQVQDGTVYALALVGQTVVVGGSFSTVTDAAQRTGYHRHALFAYDLTTGAVTDFAPQLTGTVLALAAGPGNTVYAGGTFGVAQLDVGTGQRVATFTASVNDGSVRALRYSGGLLYLGGSFRRLDGQLRPGLARVDGTTGALDAAFDLHLVTPDFPTPKIEALAVNPTGTRLVAIGVIEYANALWRPQLLMVDTTGTGAVADWYTDAYDNNCYDAFATYLRDVDFSPAGDYFVVVTTGRLTGPNQMCDTAARFEAGGTGMHHPTWVNHTGGNSLYSVDATGSAVYVGGHELWLDNPEGRKTAGPGAVYRPGIGAIDPVTGRALAWNPTRTRGVGVQAFLSTPAGLIVGSDTTQLGHEYHARLGMFPPA